MRSTWNALWGRIWPSQQQQMPNGGELQLHSSVGRRKCIHSRDIGTILLAVSFYYTLFMFSMPSFSFLTFCLYPMLLLPGDNAWADPPMVCEEYEGQKGGAFNNDIPSANSGGRTDVEGCCWWGRGVIQTTVRNCWNIICLIQFYVLSEFCITYLVSNVVILKGVCNFGKLNYYLGEIFDKLIFGYRYLAFFILTLSMFHDLSASV